MKTGDFKPALLPLGCMAAITAAALALPNVPEPRLAMFGPIMYAMAVFGDIATAVVLLSTWRISLVRRSTLVLALSFAVSGILMLLAMLTLKLMPSTVVVLRSLPQAGMWLFLSWHIAGGIGALVYLVLRRNDSAAAPPRRFLIGSVAIAGAALVAAAVFALEFSEYGPVLATHTSFAGLITTGIGPLTVAFLVLTSILVFGVRNPSRIARALALSLLALALDLAILFDGGSLYTPAFYAGRVMLLLGASFVLVAAVRTLVNARTRLNETEWKLLRAEGESANRAGRIRALWEITSNTTASQEERFNVVLQAATAAMRPGKPMFGCLTHLDGETIVIDATSWMAFDSVLEFTDRIYPGATLDLAHTLQSVINATQRTSTWDDLSVLTDGTEMVCNELGWRSLIGTPFAIGRRTHILTFTSPETMLDDPFAEDDIAYVEVVASFFASRFSQQQHFERIQFQIEHDALTGLENRVQFRKAVREEIAGGNPFTVAFVDLDGFRHVNEQHGHQIADEVLVEVAAALSSVAANHLVARMSADEFGVLLRGVSNAETARVALEEYAARFHAPFHTGDRLGTRVLRVGASIGAARFPENGKTAEDLMLRADAALCVAKNRGGSSIGIFDAAMEARLDESHIRVIELADAIAGDQLALVYQPTFDLATGKVAGAEALARWDHPERGRLMPAEFIALAERNELITPLSRWVVTRLLRDLAAAPDLPPGFRVYFNLSVETLNNIPFIAEFKELLDAAPGLVSHIGVEITETAAMDDVESSVSTLDLFRRWGLFVSIDDFGTGYSSLSYLKKLAVDVVKIDRSFITGLPEDVRDDAIADTLLQIIDRFGFTTLAEGIETEAQAIWLLAHGCRIGQGYHLARPGTFAQLLQRVDTPQAAA
jgi:diguanylate cyclase (GGDEF)-like protein